MPYDAQEENCLSTVVMRTASNVALAILVALAACAVLHRVAPVPERFATDAPRVLAISLERARARRDRLRAQAPGVEFVPAIDGATLSALEHPQPGRGRELTRGEHGCFLSHVRAWERVAASQDDYTLVLEDDANISLPEQWPAILGAVRALPPEWDLLFLGLNNPKHSSPEVAPGVKRLERDAYGMHAVVVRRSAAVTMLRAFASNGIRDAQGVRLPLDLWASRLPLAMFWADPAMVTPHDLRDSETQRVR